MNNITCYKHGKGGIWVMSEERWLWNQVQICWQCEDGTVESYRSQSRDQLNVYIPSQMDAPRKGTPVPKGQRMLQRRG